MKRLWQGNGCLAVSLVLLMICASSALAVRNDYSIEFDLNDEAFLPSGAQYKNTGYGAGAVGPWYYYPHSGEYIQWFYNDPFDPARMSNIELWVYIESVQHEQFYYVDIKFGWTKPSWNLDHPNDPRPPINLNSSAQQSQYLHTEVIKSMDKSKNWILAEGGTIEPRASFTVRDYNPQWLFVSVKGSNARIHRFVTHDCVAGGSSGGGGGGDDEPLGACCNQQTGTCFQSKQIHCPGSHHWMGAGSDCANCQTATAIWDFGDAPSFYPVSLSANGARHLVQPSIYLGNGVTVEPDGLASETASGDADDGVLFGSQLIPGSPTVLRLHASTYGVVSAWIDFNHDGDWSDQGEQVLVDAPVEPGPNSRSVHIPGTAQIGPSYARFRYSTVAGLTPVGQAPNGEVEDYLVNIGTSGFPIVPTPGTRTLAPPSEDYYSKWFQPADDSASTQIVGWPESSLYHVGPIVADDWQNDGGNQIVGIRWWGTFSAWANVIPPSPAPDSFHIALWSDDAADETPGSVVWETSIDSWSWAYAGLIQDPRGQTSGQACFEFAKMFSQDEWYMPLVDEEARYWISISARYDTFQPLNAWGWLTRTSHYENAAIRINEIQGITGPWPPSLGSSFLGGTPVGHPFNTPWDMSFDILSRRSDVPASGDVLSGVDVNADGVVDIQDISALMRIWLDD